MRISRLAFQPGNRQLHIYKLKAQEPTVIHMAVTDISVEARNTSGIQNDRESAFPFHFPSVEGEVYRLNNHTCLNGFFQC